MNPSIVAINEYYNKLSEQFIHTSVRMPKRKNNDGYSYFSSIDDLVEPPRYVGKIEKIGDQKSIVEYMKLQKKD